MSIFRHNIGSFDQDACTLLELRLRAPSLLQQGVERMVVLVVGIPQ